MKRGDSSPLMILQSLIENAACVLLLACLFIRDLLYRDQKRVKSTNKSWRKCRSANVQRIIANAVYYPNKRCNAKRYFGKLHHENQKLVHVSNAGQNLHHYSFCWEFFLNSFSKIVFLYSSSHDALPEKLLNYTA